MPLNFKRYNNFLLIKGQKITEENSGVLNSKKQQNILQSSALALGRIKKLKVHDYTICIGAIECNKVPLFF